MEEIIIEKNCLYKTKYNGDLNSLDKQINHLIEFDKGRKVSNIGGYQSNFINFGFDELLSFVLNDAKNIPLLKDKKFKLAGFWLNVNKGHHYNSIHVHAIQTSDKSANTNFYPPGWPYVCNEESKISIKPKNNKLIVFPSYLPHEVEINKDKTRLIFSANFMTRNIK